MLRRLLIRDFVIVEQTALDFDAGFTALTGETGAGKSILIDALSLALGERGDPSAVRAGAKQAEIAAEFELSSDERSVPEWLARAGLEGDPGLCLVRRIVDTGGRSRAFVNGHAATIAQLRELGEMLVDIHGQHAHQSLLRPASQRELVDDYAGSAELAAEVAESYRAWSDLTDRRTRALAESERLAREREQLEWQVRELERLDFRADDWIEMNAEHARLAHAASLIESTSACIDALSESERSAASALADVMARLNRAADIDNSLRPVLELLESARIQLEEGTHELERYRSRLEIDPQRLRAVESRLQAVHDACRKFRLAPETLADALAAAREKLARLELDLDLTRLGREIAATRERYGQAAARLSAARRKAGAKLGRAVSAALKDLAMPGARFEVALEAQSEPGLHGMERVEFRVATHAGAAPGPLSRIASGGELSRLSLAIQSVLSQVARVPTLIFDEVDAGIGGRVAEIVGRLLRRLGERHQVMCVTHLPQVAACAQKHWRVSRLERDGAAASRVEELDAQSRVEEIARMLGGLKITRASREHAAELLHDAKRLIPEA